MLKTRPTKALATTAIAVAVFLFCPGHFFPAGGAQKPSSAESFKVLERVISYIKTDYLEEPDPKKTMEGAFQGLINSLDVLSSYLDKAGVAKFRLADKLQLKDIGVVLFKRSGAFPIVIGLLENSPAAKAGIKIGDTLSAVDDNSTLIWSLTETGLRLKDLAAGKIKLRVIRDNTTKEIQVEREEIYPKSLTLASQQGTAGIVKIPHFYPPLVSEFKKSILPRILGRKAALVLDLRDCHEGSIEEARAFLNIFLKADIIGYFEKKGGAKDFLGCPDDAPLEGLPVVIWANQATMGPAEIVAGVLKDQKKVKIIGLVTTGLAAKLDLFPLGTGDGLVLSTGVFYYPSGDKLWAKGLTPDVRLDVAQTETKDYVEKTLGLLPGL